MNSSIIINQILILFFIMVIGFIVRKTGVLTQASTKSLTGFLLNVTCPLTIFISFQIDYTGSMLTAAGQVLIFALFIHFFAFLIGLALYRSYPEPAQRVLRFATIFSNCSFMGFPLLESLYGKAGVFYGSFYVFTFNLFVWTIGVRIFTGGRNPSPVKEVFTNPNIIAVGLGVVCFLLSIKLPPPVYSALELVGAMNTPLSMLVVGSILTEVKFKEMFSGVALYYGTFVRLVAIPLIALLGTNLFNFPSPLQGICVLISATPVAALTTAMAEKYNGDTHLSSRLIFLSTVFSMLTLPCFVFLVNN
ncbi:MAG: AEC family transporter [Firmicutes bacterium]|nr:AEC family transporter [Bacillota bacterium]